jgi:hypothetical protein
MAQAVGHRKRQPLQFSLILPTPTVDEACYTAHVRFILERRIASLG